MVDSLTFFSGVDASLGRELHGTDGTLAGTTIIDTNPGPAGGSPSPLTALQGQLLLQTTTPRRLWTTNEVQLTELFTLHHEGFHGRGSLGI